MRIAILVLVALVLAHVCTFFVGIEIIHVFWKWFIVPFGVQEISFWHAGGLSVFLRLLLGNKKVEPEKDKEFLFDSHFWSLLQEIVFLLFAFAIGYGFKSMM